MRRRKEREPDFVREFFSLSVPVSFPGSSSPWSCSCFRFQAALNPHWRGDGEKTETSFFLSVISILLHLFSTFIAVSFVVYLVTL